MLKTIKNLIYLAILAGAIVAFWKIFRAAEDHPTLTADQRAEQSDVQRRQAIDIRLRELETTNGKGRQRLNADVENAARMLYNTRHGANLPLVK